MTFVMIIKAPHCGVKQSFGKLALPCRNKSAFLFFFLSLDPNKVICIHMSHGSNNMKSNCIVLVAEVINTYSGYRDSRLVNHPLYMLLLSWCCHGYVRCGSLAWVVEFDAKFTTIYHKYNSKSNYNQIGLIYFNLF